MSWKFWEKKPDVTREEVLPINALREGYKIDFHVEEKPEERSGFIREMSHKHLTTRGRR